MSTLAEGVTLRDYFAAKAMPAVYRDLWDDVRAGRNGCVPEGWRMGVAIDAYKMADAMVSARQAGALAPSYRELRDTLRTIEAESTDDNAREWARRALEEFGGLA